MSRTTATLIKTLSSSRSSTRWASASRSTSLPLADGAATKKRRPTPLMYAPATPHDSYCAPANHPFALSCIPCAHTQCMPRAVAGGWDCASLRAAAPQQAFVRGPAESSCRWTRCGREQGSSWRSAERGTSQVAIGRIRVWRRRRHPVCIDGGRAGGYSDGRYRRCF